MYKSFDDSAQALVTVKKARTQERIYKKHKLFLLRIHSGVIRLQVPLS